MSGKNRNVFVLLAMIGLTAAAFALGVLVGPQAARPVAAQPAAWVEPVAEDQVLTAGTFRRIAARTRPAVVSITTRQKVSSRGAPHPLPEDDPRDFFEWFFGPRHRSPNRERSREVFGSGVIISRTGEILTNNHVVEKGSEITVALPDGRTFEAEVLGRDPWTDVALIRIKGEDLPSIPLGDSDRLEVGDWVVAIGNPFQYRYSVTVGVVSAKEREIGAGPYDDYIQIDAAINPGNSGGPLLDLSGRVVGINTAIITDGFRQSAGIGFAIPVNLIREILPQLREKGHVDRGYLGVFPQDVTPEIAEGLDLSHDKGALIVRVDPKTPAAEAGLEEYDVIVAWNGAEVADSHELRKLVAATPPGGKATVTVVRNGRKKSFKIRVAERPNLTDSGRLESPAASRLGMEVQDVTPELAQRLDLPVTSGVLVTSVEAGSPAQKAGLRRGDVILEVNTREVEDTAGFRKAVRERAGGTAVLRVRRANASLIVPIRVPE